MTELEQAAAELRKATAEHATAQAALVAHLESIERIQALTAGLESQRNTASAAVRRARENLCAIAAPKEITTP